MTDQTDGPSEIADDQTVAVRPPDSDEPPAPLWRRLLFGAFVALAVVFFIGAMLYRFGSMAPPSAEARAAYAALEEQGKVPHVTQRQFHIPIPGCTCHSDDPVLVIQHEDRRISECMGCHGG